MQVNAHFPRRSHSLLPMTPVTARAAVKSLFRTKSTIFGTHNDRQRGIYNQKDPKGLVMEETKSLPQAKLRKRLRRACNSPPVMDCSVVTSWGIIS